MRLVFAGTPSFAAIALDAILAAGHDVRLVLTQPDRMAGRGLRLHPSAVKQLVAERCLPLFQPLTLRDPAVVSMLERARPEVIVVAAYGQILPQRVLDLPPLGALNIHASLLPRWRGAAPIQRAILAGDTQTGISIMRMEAGLDTGPVLARHALAIGDQDDSGTLQDKLARLGADMIVDRLAALERGAVTAQPQPDTGVTYAKKIGRTDTVLDWTQGAQVLERTVRAFRPDPGASTEITGIPVKVWRSGFSVERGRPGTVLRVGPEGLLVACGTGALTINELQRAGGKRMPIADFLRGQAIVVGQRLGP